jgi:hypothetical protein
MTKNVHEPLSWLKTTEGLSYSEILAMGYGGVLNEALRDGLVKAQTANIGVRKHRKGRIASGLELRI